MRDGVSADGRVVKRLINGTVVTIVVAADSKRFREHEAYASWDTRDPTWSPSYVVDLNHIGHLFPGPHAYPGGEHGGFNFHTITVELLLSKKIRRQDRRFASTDIFDLPQTHDRRVCFSSWRKRKAAKHHQNCTEYNI
jgi:hypothetical protein